ncbi:MAG: NAD-dependent dehydratase [Nocardioides sp.]|nr:NAD-dependent dehydratase [Nocardioides sp.]
MATGVDVLVAGGGGFIGGHLVADLLAQGRSVRSVDVKPMSEWYQVHDGAENIQGDLSLLEHALSSTEGAGEVYMLAADMGGMGFIENNKALCMLSVLTSTHMLQAAQQHGVGRYFYSSSACVYAADKQTNTDITALREADAYPAMPEDGYGWEKLFTERMCRHFSEDYGLTTRVARYHNVYGPDGTWTGGREKAPAAVCRKIAEAVISGDHEIDIWGDGEQTRSFMYIDDCVQGSQMILNGESAVPVNLGSSELVSINQLVSIVEGIAGIRCERHYQLDAPQGVRGRNSDNTQIIDTYGWEPSISLADGLARTYAWVYDQVKRAQG